MSTTLDRSVLTYRSLLANNRDLMVAVLIEQFRLDRTAAELMIDQLWDRLVNRLVADYNHLGVDRPMAERIMNETLGFLNLCRRQHGHGPSFMVDLGWHTFILYTMEYTAFCTAFVGYYLHHLPTDVVGFNDSATSGKCNYHCADKCNNNCSSVAESVDAVFADGTCFAPNANGAERFSIPNTIAALAKLGPVDIELWSMSAPA